MATTPPEIHVLHVTPWYSHRGGGVAWYIQQLVEHGHAAGLRATVAGLHDPLNDSAPAGASIVSGKLRGSSRLGYSLGLHRALESLPADIQVVHAHGLRMWPSYEARRLAVRRGLPLIISPHGGTDPWVIASGRWGKRIVGWWFDNANLRAASCFHATVPQEARHLRAYGQTAPVAIVPIGLDSEPYHPPCDEQALVTRWPELGGKRRLLFLTTIYRKKRLPDLADAWLTLQARWPDWQLIIGGREASDDLAVVKQRLMQAGALHRCTIVGAVDEPTKRQLLSCSNIYVLPTAGENFGISIAESLAAGTPVLTTRTTPWHELVAHDCGWWIEPGGDLLRQTLEQAMTLTDDQRQAMGRRGQALIERQYRWDRIVMQMRSLYEWVIGHGTQPDFVYRCDQSIPDK